MWVSVLGSVCMWEGVFLCACLLVCAFACVYVFGHTLEGAEGAWSRFEYWILLSVAPEVTVFQRKSTI